MKMLFFSSQRAEVEQVRKEFIEAGIPCEVHVSPDGQEGEAEEPKAEASSDTELWIQNDGDSHKALMLCVERGVGFGKRAPKKEAELWNDEVMERKASEEAEGEYGETGANQV
jgi:hypothetical protein